MHPRNPYKDKKPDFKALALKYEEFRKHTTQDSKEHVHVDFKKPECMRALSWALLKEDFGLDVEMPLNRLIPTVPLRLNYILWIEDLLAQRRDGVKGIDIGTGASCVYPCQELGHPVCILANNWGILCELGHPVCILCWLPRRTRGSSWQPKQTTSTRSMQDATWRGMDCNMLFKVSPHTKLCGAVSNGDRYDFCMCNPPFFGSNLEAWGMLTSRSDDRPEPKSVSTASPQESIVTGGEVEFVKQIILDSLELKNKIRIYTTMLGKKSSLAPLKAELHKHGISKFGTTELCQGRTMRWALGWTFEDDVVFKPPISKLSRQKPRPPLLLKLQCQCGENNKGKSGVEDMNDRIVQLLNQLQKSYLGGSVFYGGSLYYLTPVIRQRKRTTTPIAYGTQ
ncbi:RNA N6-adenosine-methyltransferase mettl16 [Lamellibrachia satsuma]|nr:RNA N6-adenosine-methyltransferase mettl16 [Lamellibrachia satsuma]